MRATAQECGSGVKRDSVLFVDFGAQRLARFIFICAALCFCGYTTSADIQKEESRKLVEQIRAKAEKGNPDEQYLLGFIYRRGELVVRDPAEGVRWLRKAAEQGHPEAQFVLGLCYSSGDGVRENDAEALKWFRKAAEQGHAYGQRLVGAFYHDGTGVRQDYAEAVKWFRKAAEQGNADAQCDIGRCYHLGKGVRKDYEEAVKWFHKAAVQGCAEAEYLLGLCYKHGNGVVKDFIEAAKWFRKAAQQGHADAQYALGFCYYLGEGVDTDYNEAAKWIRKAAEQGNGAAQDSLGRSYLSGRGVPKDYVEAYKWILLAAAQGVEDAKEVLGPIERQLMTRQQIAEGQQLARKFQARKAVPLGNSLSTSEIMAAQPECSGTGFFITSDGYLVTNEHVVSGGGQVRLLTSAGLIVAKVVKLDSANDLAILKAEGKFSALAVTSSRRVSLGQTATTVGFPNVGLQGFAPKLAKGEIASLAGARDDARHFQISLPIQPGNSGGALVDERGNVIGVIVAKLSREAAVLSSGQPAENVNYAVKSSFLLGLLESLPAVADQLKQLNTRDRRFEEVVREAQEATVLVLVY